MIRRTATAWVLCTLWVGVLAHPPGARAQQREAVRAEGISAPVDRGYWSRGTARPFVASRLEAGLLYSKAQVAFGYGTPYWTWIGIEAYGMSTNSFAAGYLGMRAALPFLNLSLGARDSYAYYRSFLPIQDQYKASDVANLTGPHSRYVAMEAELSSVLPVPTGYLLVAATLYAVSGAPAHAYVYEESLRGVIKPPFMWAGRLAYLAGFGRDDFVKAGLLTELVGLPGRDRLIFRAGPVVSVTLTDHLDAVGAFSPVFISPDSLGIWHGPFGQLGLRYSFASGEAKPRFP